MQKKLQNIKLCCFPRRVKGVIKGYDNDDLKMPNKIMEMGLLPGTEVIILYQAPFNGVLYIEYGKDRACIALREEEAGFIYVESLEHEY